MVIILALASTLGGVIAVALAVSPTLSGVVEEWLTTAVAARPREAFAAMEDAVKRQDHASAVREALRFIDSIPFPHRADAFGERFRQALRIAGDSGQAMNDLPLQLRVGEIAWRFDPRDSVLGYAYGRALAAAGRNTEAAVILDAVHLMQPTSTPLTEALAAAYRETGQAERVEGLGQRHLEAVALSYHLPGLSAGALIYYGAGQSHAVTVRLGSSATADVSVRFDVAPDGAYFALPEFPRTQLRFEVVEIVADGRRTPVKVLAQQNMRQVDAVTIEAAHAPAASLDAPGVIAVVWPTKPPAGAELRVRIRVEPAADLQAWLTRYGGWDHPYRPTAVTMLD